MKRTLSALAAAAALAVLAHARPASACSVERKTTVTKADEKAPPQKAATAKQEAKDEKTGDRAERGAQARNDAGKARPERR